MRIDIDATPLLLRSAGIKSYFYHWIRHLRAAAGGDAIRVFPFLGRFGALTHEESVAGAWSTWPRLGLLYFLNVPGNPAMDLLVSGADLFHCSNQVRVPPRRIPLTATIHDMTCWLMPELHTPANVKADRNFADTVLRKAVGLIAVSENTKRDAVRILDLDPSRVSVIYSGIPEAYFQVTREGVRRIAELYRLDKPYILYVGTIEPRKNLDTLLDAYAQLAPSLRQEVDLVIVGPVGWARPETYRRLTSPAPGVRYLGYIPEHDLPFVTAGATLLAYLSLYEGFGFPVAQAMACGVPVVVSNVSSLPEVAGNAGLQADPRSAAAVRDAIDRLLSSPALRGELGRLGRERARRFRWEVCARESLEFFRRAAGR